MAGRAWVGILATGAIALAGGAIVGGNLGAAAATATYEPQVVAAEQDASAAQAEAEEAQQKTSDVIAESNRVSDENAAVLAEQQAQLDETIAVRDDYRANLLLALGERDAAIAEADRGWDAYDELYDAAQVVLVEATALVESTDAVLDEAQTQLDIASAKNTNLINALLLLDAETARLRTRNLQLESAIGTLVDLVNQIGALADRAMRAAWAERDAALMERDAALAASDPALRAERDAALAARDAALAERDAALEDADGALQTENDALQAENDALRAEVEALRAERDEAVTQRDEAAGQRDTAMGERDALTAEKTELIAHLSTCQSDLRLAQSAAANLSDAVDLLWAGDVDGSDAAWYRAMTAADSVSGTC